MLWDVYGECRNYNVLSGHKNAVLEVQWTYDSAQVISASADKTVGVWDAQVRVHLLLLLCVIVRVDTIHLTGHHYVTMLIDWQTREEVRRTLIGRE